MRRITDNLRNRKWIRPAVVALAVIIGVSVAARLATYASARGRIYTDVNRIPKCRVAMVLGAKVHSNGHLSVLLKDRVRVAVELYKAGKAEKLLMSGDNRFTHYNEPQRMADWAIAHGVPKKDIVMDFAGRRTYDSVYRAKHIFGLNKMIVVSQGFHLDRTMFLCRHIGVNAYGMSADVRGHGKIANKLRELPACMGALVDVYLRTPHPVMGKKERV